MFRLWFAFWVGEPVSCFLDCLRDCPLPSCVSPSLHLFLLLFSSGGLGGKDVLLGGAVGERGKLIAGNRVMLLFFFSSFSQPLTHSHHPNHLTGPRSSPLIAVPLHHCFCIALFFFFFAWRRLRFKSQLPVTGPDCGPDRSTVWTL